MAGKKTESKDKRGTLLRAVVKVKHVFDAEEWTGLGQTAARAQQVIDEKVEAHKAALAVIKAEIKDLESKLSEVMNKLNNGYEEREVEALVEMDRKRGKKKLLHNAPGKPHHKELIREEAMTDADFEALPLPEDEQQVDKSEGVKVLPDLEAGQLAEPEGEPAAE